MALSFGPYFLSREASLQTSAIEEVGASFQCEPHIHGESDVVHFEVIRDYNS